STSRCRMRVRRPTLTRGIAPRCSHFRSIASLHARSLAASLIESNPSTVVVLLLGPIEDWSRQPAPSHERGMTSNHTISAGFCDDKASRIAEQEEEVRTNGGDAGLRERLVDAPGSLDASAHLAHSELVAEADHLVSEPVTDGAVGSQFD